MKKLAALLAISAVATGAFAQGLIGFANTSGTLFATNGVALGLGSGTTATAAGGFYYSLFVAPSTVTTATAADLLTSTWSWTGNYATNTAATTGGRMSGGNNIPTVNNVWAAGVTNSYVVAGWSANLGHDWSAIAAQLAGATLAGGEWTGPNWASASQNGYFGISLVGFGEPGGVTPSGTLPYLPLFGSGPAATGTPITSPTTLFVVTVPEPTTIALAGLGAAAMLIFRRRK